jgi:hypothetical protein
MAQSKLIWIMLGCLLTIGTESRAQRDLQWTWPSQLHAGFTFLEKKAAQDSEWQQGIGSHILLTTGMGFRYKQHFGLEGNLGLHVSGVQLTKETEVYNVSNLALMPGALAYGMIKLSDAHSSYIRLGLEFGRVFPADVRLNKEIAGDVIISETVEHTRTYWTPLIGISKIDKRNLLSITAGYHFTTNPNYYMRVSVQQQDGGYARYEGTGNALTVSVNYAYTLRGHKDKPLPKVIVPNDAAILSSREEKALPALHSKSRTVHLELWDQGDEDQDSISVQLNGEFILTNYELTSRKIRIKLNLQEGENRVVFMAHNEGRFPPNTAQCAVKIGRKRKLVTVASDLEYNAGLVIFAD